MLLEWDLAKQLWDHQISTMCHIILLKDQHTTGGMIPAYQRTKTASVVILFCCCDLYRFKPDIVAPGDGLLSADASGTNSQSCATTQKTGKIAFSIYTDHQR